MKLINKYILIIFGLLFLQMGFTMFYHTTADDTVVDTTIRNAALSLFGYIVSSNFVRSHKMIEEHPKEIKKEYSQQLLVTFIICVGALLYLAMAKNLNFISVENHYNLAIIKSIFSGSVGFLIGLQKENP